MTTDTAPHLLFARDDHVEVEYRQIVVAARGGTMPKLDPPSTGVLWAGLDGALLASGAYEHRAQLRIELWSAEPQPDTSRAWESRDDACLPITVDEIAYGSAITLPPETAVKLPAAGTYGIRVYSEGRSAAQAADDAAQDLHEDDEVETDSVPDGTEKWLVQLWLLAAR